MKRHVAASIAVLLAVLLASMIPLSAAEASENQEEEEELALLFSSAAKVSGVSKARQPEDIREAAAQVTVISRQEIQAFGYRTLEDVLQTVPESFAGGDRVYGIAGIRGFARAGDYNSRVLLLLDGHAINEPWNNYAPIGRDFPIDLSLVERIEVIAGPVSSLYGTNAFFGAINVVTRTPEKAVSGGAYTAGSHGYNGITAWYGNGSPPDGSDGKEDPPWHFLAYATGMDSSGETLHYPALAGGPDGGTERGTDWDRSGAGYVRMSRGRVSIAATAYSRRRGIIAGQYESRFGDGRSWTSDSRAAAEIGVNVLKGPAVNLRVRAYGDVYRYEDLYRYDPDPVFYDVAIARWAGAESIFEWNAGSSSLVVSLEDTFAHVTQDSFERRAAGTDAPDPDAPVNATPADVRSFNLLRGSIHETFRAGDRLRLVGGLYVEHHDFYGSALAPRGGVIAHPWAGGTVKALYGRGFRTPSIYEAFFDDGDALTGNPELRAETVDGYEVAARQSVGKDAEVFGSAFHGEYRDVMVQVPDVDVDPDPVREDLRQQYQNRARVRGSGATGGFHVRARGLVLRVDASGFIHGDDEAAGGASAVLGSPEWVAHVVGILPVDRGRASLAARLSAVGARPGREGRRLAPYVLADIGVRVRRIWRNLGMHVALTNVFDTRYGAPAGEEYAPATLPGPGRRVFLQLRWEGSRAPGR